MNRDDKDWPKPYELANPFDVDEKLDRVLANQHIIDHQLAKIRTVIEFTAVGFVVAGLIQLLTVI